jgi:hypothetical protein
VGLLLIIVVGFSCVSFHLLEGTRNAQEQATEIAKQWHDVAVETLSSARQANLLTALERWHTRNRYCHDVKQMTFCGQVTIVVNTYFWADEYWLGGARSDTG